MAKKKVTVVRCPICGFKNRGKKHDEGDHHKQGKNGKASIRKL